MPVVEEVATTHVVAVARPAARRTAPKPVIAVVKPVVEEQPPTTGSDMWRHMGAPCLSVGAPIC